MPTTTQTHANKPDSSHASTPKPATAPTASQSNLSVDQQTVMQIQRMAGNQAALRFVQRQAIQREPGDDMQKRSFKADLNAPMFSSSTQLMIGTLAAPLVVHIPGSPPGTVSPNQPVIMHDARTIASSLETQLPANIKETN